MPRRGRRGTLDGVAREFTEEYVAVLLRLTGEPCSSACGRSSSMPSLEPFLVYSNNPFTCDQLRGSDRTGASATGATST